MLTSARESRTKKRFVLRCRVGCIVCTQSHCTTEDSDCDQLLRQMQFPCILLITAPTSISKRDSFEPFNMPH